MQRGLCQHQRRQKPDGTPGARCLAHLDEQGQHAQRCLIGGDRAKLHGVGCHIIRNACCEAGLKSQREVVVPALATEKLTEPRVDVDAWGHPGLRTYASTSLLSMQKLFTTPRSEEGTRAGTGSSTNGEGERKQMWKNERRDRSHGHCYSAQWALWPRTGYPPSPARRILASNRQSSGESQRTTPAGMAKTPERRAGKIYRCDNPLGRRAPGLERKASSLAMTLPDPFGTEPFSCEHRVKYRDRARDRDRDRDLTEHKSSRAQMINKRAGGTGIHSS